MAAQGIPVPTFNAPNVPGSAPALAPVNTTGVFNALDSWRRQETEKWGAALKREAGLQGALTGQKSAQEGVPLLTVDKAEDAQDLAYNEAARASYVAGLENQFSVAANKLEEENKIDPGKFDQLAKAHIEGALSGLDEETKMRVQMAGDRIFGQVGMRVYDRAAEYGRLSRVGEVELATKNDLKQIQNLGESADGLGAMHLADLAVERIEKLAKAGDIDGNAAAGQIYQIRQEAIKSVEMGKYNAASNKETFITRYRASDPAPGLSEPEKLKIADEMARRNQAVEQDKARTETREANAKKLLRETMSESAREAIYSGTITNPLQLSSWMADKPYLTGADRNDLREELTKFKASRDPVLLPETEAEVKTAILMAPRGSDMTGYVKKAYLASRDKGEGIDSNSYQQLLTLAANEAEKDKNDAYSQGKEILQTAFGIRDPGNAMLAGLGMKEIDESQKQAALVFSQWVSMVNDPKNPANPIEAANVLAKQYGRYKFKKAKSVVLNFPNIPLTDTGDKELGTLYRNGTIDASTFNTEMNARDEKRDLEKGTK